MAIQSWIRKLFSFQSPLSSKKAKPFTQLNLLSLEERIVPAVPFSPAYPYVISINTATDNSGTLADTSASFNVTFDCPVTGVDAKDFTPVTTGQVVTGSLSVIGSGTTYKVTVSDVKGGGTLGVNLVDAPTISAAVSFAPQNAFSTGSGSKPNSVTMGDVDGDSMLDIVTANSSSQTVSVRLGNGNGTFKNQNTFAVGNNPQSVTLGDVNGDGRLDLVTANASSQSVSVLLGNGNGTFKNENTFAVVNDPQSVTLGDVNGDGRLDIVTANNYSSTVSVLLGTGDGTFGSLNNFATDNIPVSVALGDVNGDGKLDIVTANFGSKNASVLLGTGTGTFANLTTFATGNIPTSVALGDVNVDGKVDIVTTNFGSNNASVLLGNGNGTFAGQITFAVGKGPTALTLGDFNGDGRLDIVTANRDNNTASVLPGNGDGTFADQVTFAVGSKPQSMMVGDVNGDGRLDLAIANKEGDTVSVLLGAGTSAPSVNFSTASTPSTGNAQRSIATGDVNGDGKLDIVASNFGSKNASVLLGNGNGTFQNQKSFATGDIPLYVTVGDVNSDGKLDIVTANSESNTVSVLLGDGKGSFGGPTTFAVGSYSFAVKLGDINGDGRLDIVTVNQRSSNLSILLGNGDGTFKNQSTFALGSNPDSLALGDVNNDGRLDIVTTNFGSIAGVLLGNGNGTFKDLTTFAVDFRIGSVVLGDVNDDGKLDIVAENAQNDSASVHLGNGNGTFKSQTTFAVGDTPLSVGLGEFNGDGRLDIVTTNNLSNTTSVLLGNGNGTFKSQTTFAVETFPDCVVLGDVNNDGRLDIITANRNNNASVLLNSLAFSGKAHTYSINKPFAPTITSGNKVFFPNNRPGNFTVTATAFPAATFSINSWGLPTGHLDSTTGVFSGILPPGLTLDSGTGVISGIAKFEKLYAGYDYLRGVPFGETLASYEVNIIASNGIGLPTFQTITFEASQAFTSLIRLSVPPTVTTGNNPNVGTEVALSVGTEVTLRDPVTGKATKTITPFPGFSGEVRVAVGDTTGDGNLETILSAGPGGGPAIVVVNSTTGEVMSSFFAYDPAFRGGVFVATQDVNNDGSMDIVTGAGPGGGPHVKVFNRGTNESIMEFFAYDSAFQGGVSVACADLNNDGVLEIITGAGPGGAPHVKVFDGATGAMISQWFAYDSSFRGGVFVAAGDLDNDGNFEVITGAGEGGAPVVAIWNAMNGSLINQFLAYDPEFRGGVRVGITDVDLDGDLELVTGAGPGGGPHIKVFEYPELSLIFSFFNGDPDNRDGVFVS